MQKIHKIIIPGELPGLNEILKTAKATNYFKTPTGKRIPDPKAYTYDKMKKEYTELMRLYSLRAHKCKGMVDMRIWFFSKDKRRDKDNISGGGCKMLFDGLVAAGIVPNDTWEYIGDYEIKHRVDKQRPRIEVEYWEVEDECIK